MKRKSRPDLMDKEYFIKLHLPLIPLIGINAALHYGRYENIRNIKKAAKEKEYNHFPYCWRTMYKQYNINSTKRSQLDLILKQNNLIEIQSGNQHTSNIYTVLDIQNKNNFIAIPVNLFSLGYSDEFVVIIAYIKNNLEYANIEGKIFHFSLERMNKKLGISKRAIKRYLKKYNIKLRGINKEELSNNSFINSPEFILELDEFEKNLLEQINNEELLNINSDKSKELDLENDLELDEFEKYLLDSIKS